MNTNGCCKSVNLFLKLQIQKLKCEESGCKSGLFKYCVVHYIRKISLFDNLKIECRCLDYTMQRHFYLRLIRLKGDSL